MLVYRDAWEPVQPRRAWADLRESADALVAADRDAVTALLIEAGEIASAVADRLFPDADGLDARADALQDATFAAARLFTAVVGGARDLDARHEELRVSIRRVEPGRLPEAASRRVSEGYAYYALHPETYAEAARRCAAAVRPPSAACIGLRSIGMSLSAVVAAALCDAGVPATLWSVRPRGHPFDRRLALGAPLEAALRARPRGTHWFVVDEGPGLSGSSFAAAARALSALGIPDSHIVFFPSWNADGGTFRSVEARTVWRRHRRWFVPASDAGAGIARVTRDEAAVDFSAGAWRPHLIAEESRWPAVQTRDERVKAFLPHACEIVRFAGLGRYGSATLDRARALAAEGLGAQPIALAGGYLRLRFVEGVPCTPADATPDLLRQAARHVAVLRRTQPSPRATAVDELHHMIETNIGEADATLRVPPRSHWAAAIEHAPSVALDARMLAHEWVRTAGGYLKTDALDHARGHFFPGAQDAAWDLAALEAEFALPPSATEMLLRAYAAESHDAGVAARLPFHRVAYAAFQLGYAALARQSLGDEPDGRRFERRAAFFLDRLRGLLAR